MAFIPDEAIDRLAELSKGARLLYVFLARCRNQKTGKCHPSVAFTMEHLDCNRGTVYTLRNELSKAGWAHFEGDNVTNLYGFSSLKNQTTDDANAEDRAESLKNQTSVSADQSEKSDSLKNQTPDASNKELSESLIFQTVLSESENSDSPSLKNQTKQSEKSDSHIRNNQQKEPAKGESAPPPITPDFGSLIRAYKQVTGFSDSLGQRAVTAFNEKLSALWVAGVRAPDVDGYAAAHPQKLLKWEFLASDLLAWHTQRQRQANGSHSLPVLQYEDWTGRAEDARKQTKGQG